MDTERNSFELGRRPRAPRLASLLAALCMTCIFLLLPSACASTDPFADAAEELGADESGVADSSAAAPRYLEGWSALDASAPPAALAALMDGNLPDGSLPPGSLPLRDGNRIWFAVRAPGAASVTIVASFNAPGGPDALATHGDSPWFWKGYTAPDGAKASYVFLARDASGLATQLRDPVNPAVEPKGHYMSVMKEPGASRLEFLELPYSLPGRAVPDAYAIATRRVLVYLPSGYDADPDRRYPVLYFQDGQNVWDSSTANYGGWKADAVIDRMLAAGDIRPAIIVSIFNTGYRSQEYAGAGFHRVSGDARALAIAEYYRDWTLEILKPEIDRRYRTLPGRADTGVVGSSYGGTLAAYWALSRPEVFGMAAAVSYAPGDGKDASGGMTALAREKFLPTIAAASLALPRFWLDCGTAGLDATLVPAAEALDGVLRDAGYEEGTVYRFTLFPGADHNEAAWYRRLPAILGFLLPPDDGAGE
ncbi:MAG: esterase family protein [Spirochaetales bacterium]|nr:esterase family protein [Spirochaetales bacterium]